MNVSLQAAKYRAILLPLILLVCFMIINVVLAYGQGNLVSKLKRTGFQRRKQFYIPKPEQLPAGMQDKRRVLYWNPNLVSSAAGVAELEYVNPGYAGKFKVVIEGINGDGQMGRSVYYYELK